MYKIFKRLTCFVLVIMTLVGIFSISLNTVYADSNDRIATYIKLAADGEVTDGDTSDMTEEQLRFLGVYLSNFYIPFGTEIGVSAGELADTTKADMIETLQQKFAFSDELSNSIVETIFGYTRSSLQELGVYIKDGDDFVDLSTYISPSYFNFARIMMGRTDSVVAMMADGVNYKDIDTKGEGSNKDGNLNKVSENIYGKSYNELSSSKKKDIQYIYKLIAGAYDKIYFCYANGNDLVVMADAYVGEEWEDGSYTCPKVEDSGTESDVNYTASQIAYLKCLEASGGVEFGYGTNIIDIAKSDGADDEGLKELLTSADNESFAKMTVMGSMMAVDCFGDLISLGGNHQVVVIPGCMNPFIWKTVDSSGNDISSEPPGSVYNIANAISMTESGIDASDGLSMLIDQWDGSMNTTAQALNSALNIPSDPIFNPNPNSNNSNNSNTSTTVDTEDGRFKFRANFSSLNEDLNNMILEKGWCENVKGEVETMVDGRITRGTNEIELNTGSFLFVKWAADDPRRDFLKKAIKGYHSLYPYDCSFYLKPSEYDSFDYSQLLGVGYAAPRNVYANSSNKFLGVKPENNITILTNVVLIDNLGTYQNTDGSVKEYSFFNVAPFIDETTGKPKGSNDVTFGKFNFGNLYNDIQSGKMSVPYDASETALCTLYVTYCWAGLYDETSKADTIGKLGYRMNIEDLPSMSNKPISLGEMEGVDYQLGAIKDWTYYLLHPTDGFDYVKLLITNKVNHLLLGWHSDMVGTNGVGVSVGTTKYRSNMGYVTMPDLSEIKWTDSLINLYNDCIPFLIIILIIIMIFAFITGILDFQHAILGILLFSIFTLIPVNLLNASVQQSNRISQNIYGEKFTYWALVQQESYAQAIDEAANATGSSGTSSYNNYLRTLYDQNEEVYSNQGNESILIKWQAPKKMASLVLTESDAKSLDGLSETGQQMLSGMLNNTYDGQSYTEDEDAVYMYRSYLDISNFSRYIYNGIDDGTVKHKSFFNNVDTSNWFCFQNSNGSLINSSSDLSEDYIDYVGSGYTNGSDFDTNSSLSDQFYLTVPMSSNIINDVLSVYGTIDTFKDSNDMVPINSDVFNFGIPMFTNSTVKFDADTFAATGFITDADRKQDLSTYMGNYTSEEDYVGLAAFGLYSENPYYYFSWKLYSDGLDSNSSLSGATGYKNLLLGKEDGGYFYNTKGNGGLKDFMNMKGLFTYTIPYMKQCNDIVREWDDTFGIFVYEGVPTEEGHWDEVENDPELKAQYWHNLNVTRLYSLYCPWVDVMYDCSYAEAETINVLGKKVVVDDPLNPNCYPDERPMIFSESEMADYGLTEADLTKVEKLILDCNEGYQERMYELLNYYNFSDVTLNSAAAMNCAFVFNSTFSENGLFTDNHNIYPQSFDLANFSYDAFLRLILANSTGEDLLDTSTSTGTKSGDTSGDFYERIVNNSSTITIIVMLILDVISVYLIPAFRIFFLVAMFLASVMIILVSAFKIEDNIKFITKVLKQFVLPLCLFFLSTIGFSMVVSLFMGVGSNAVTETDNVDISMGDPVVTMLIMIAINIILLIIYWKIIKGALKDIKHHGKLIGGFVQSLGGAAVGFAAGALAAGVSTAQNTGSRIHQGLRNHKMNKFLKKGDKTLDNISDAQQGTGVENTRANTRGSTGASESSEEYPSNVRDVDKDKREAGLNNSEKSNEESEAKKKEINEKAETGSEDLEREYKIGKTDRTMRDVNSMDKGFDYAKDENGTVNPDKLSAKDRYKYKNRRDRINNREDEIQKEESKNIKSTREEYSRRQNAGDKSKGSNSKPNPRRSKVDTKPNTNK